MPSPILHVIYAGRGDCMILECDAQGAAPAPARQYILIDGGPKYYWPFGGNEAPYHNYLSHVIGRLMGNGQTITQAIISHPHEDHYGGYKTLLANGRPPELALFIPQNSLGYPNASDAVIGDLNFADITTPPQDDYLFAPVKAIFPPRNAIQYCHDRTRTLRPGTTNVMANNEGNNPNRWSILMYTAIPNELPMFFTGDGYGEDIAKYMGREFQAQLNIRFTVYKMQHHGALDENSMGPGHTIKYHENMDKEAFIFELCRILARGLAPMNKTIEVLTKAAAHVIQERSAITNYYAGLLRRRRRAQNDLRAQAFPQHQPGQAPQDPRVVRAQVVVMDNPPNDGAGNFPKLTPNPVKLYNYLYEKFSLKQLVSPWEWTSFGNEATQKYKNWETVNKAREFYSKFEADAYVVSTNSMVYPHPVPAVVAGLAIAVREQGRRARLYLTSGYSLKVAELRSLVAGLYLEPTDTELFCGNNLTIRYLSTGPYMSISGDSALWNSVGNDRDIDKVTRQLIFQQHDQLYMDDLYNRFEDIQNMDGRMVIRRLVKCRIKVQATGEEVFPIFGNGPTTWGIAVAAPAQFYVRFDDIPTPQSNRQDLEIYFFESESSTRPSSFKCYFHMDDGQGLPLWHWTNASETSTLILNGQNAVIAPMPQLLAQVASVYVERVIDNHFLMMMELGPTFATAEMAESQPAPSPTPSLQQVLQDMQSPFFGVDTVDLITLLKFLFGNDNLLKQTLEDMPQLILHAGFLDLDVSLPTSTAITTMAPVIGKVITSSTLACQTKPTSTIKWPAQLNIADLTLSLDKITVTVTNCQKKQVAMLVESSVSLLSGSGETPDLQLGMAWSSSGPASDTGPIVSFRAGLGDLSGLIKALGGGEDDIKGILKGEIPFTPEKSSAPPTLKNPSAPTTEIGFSLFQPAQATYEYKIHSIWVKTKLSSWSAYLPLPGKFDKIVAEACIQVFHPLQRAQRAVGGSVAIDIPIPPPPADKDNGRVFRDGQAPRNLSASLSAIPYPGPGATNYDYRLRIVEQVDGVNLQDLARVAQEYFDVPNFTSGIFDALPGLGKVAEVIRVRELAFGVGKTRASGWSFDEFVLELSIPAFELLPGMVSLVDSRVRVQSYYDDGISFSGEAVFMVQSGSVNKQAIVGFSTPTLSTEGSISFKAPGGFNLADIFNAFDLGDISQVPVLSDIATIDILSTEVKFMRPKGGATSISSASAELLKVQLDLGVLTFRDLKLQLKWEKVRPPETKQLGTEEAGSDVKREPTPSSFVTLDFSTFIPSINSNVQITYDGMKRVMKGSLTSAFQSAASLGQILQAPIPGSGKDTTGGQAEAAPTGSFLTAYFDRDSVDALAKILDAVKIRSYSIEYGKKGTGANFALAGVLGLGPLDLSLTLSVDSDKDSKTSSPDQGKKKEKSSQTESDQDKQSKSQQTWKFLAKLSVPTESATPPPPDVVKLGDLLSSLIGDDVKDSLPPFLANIEFSRPKSDNELSLTIEKVVPGPAVAQGTTPSPAQIVFCIKISILGFSFSYTQCQECVDTKVASGNGKSPSKPTKRILSASLDAVPDIKIPLIGDVPKPVDQILYLWVQDTSVDKPVAKKAAGAGPETEKKDKPRGLTNAEVTAINKVLESSKMAPLVFKQTQGKLADNTVVLATGHHFMMVGKDSLGKTTVILDYVFGQHTAPEAQPKQPLPGKDGKPVDTPPSPSEKDTNPKAPGLAPYKKAAGPLSISNIGFGWTGTPKEGGTLSISLDASITMGPVGFGLIGLKVKFPITSQTSLRNWPTPEVTIDGLAASFNKPPLMISGAFLHKVVEEDDIYAGALLIGYSAYLFQAVGFYGDMTDPVTKTKFPSAFMFCRFNGTLMSVGWAELSGLVAGLGYNSSIAFPQQANEVSKFPLIAPPPTSPDPDPMALLKIFMDPTKPSGGIISPKIDSFWIAAGVKVTAFQVLQVTAILVLSFDPHLKIGIFGLAVADLPPAPAGSGPGKFVHVELALSATLDTSLGVLKIMGGLTPNSYLLDPNCHLTGGFAMYSWFDSPDPALKGDWVFTIGGYHRSFSPPAHYPPPETVPRLGISWSFSRNISITGEAYFAITPKMCMAGGRLDVTLRAGPLKAWFNAYADFLINYKPFHFIAEGGVQVGVECTVDFCIVSISVSATLGATLYLEGPPIRGTVTVKFWVMEFDVNFGNPPEAVGDVDLSQFFDLVLQGGSGGANMLGASGQNADGKGKQELHVFSCRSGLIPTVGGDDDNDKDKKNEEGKDKPWVVRGAAFAFNVSSLFAMADCTVISAGKRDEKATEKNSATWSWWKEGQAKPHAKPMKSDSPLYSNAEIRIYRQVPTRRDGNGVASLMALADDSDIPRDDGTDAWNRVQRVIRPLSSAIWGRYDTSTDPSRREANQKAMLSSNTGGTVNLMTGVDIHGPDAKLSAETAIEFNVAEAMGMDAADPDHLPMFPITVLYSEDDVKTLVPLPPSNDWEVDAQKIKDEWKAKTAVAGEVLDMWTTKLAAFSQWDLGSDNHGKLQATAPVETIRRFDELYLDMPWMTAEGASQKTVLGNT